MNEKMIHDFDSMGKLRKNDLKFARFEISVLVFKFLDIFNPVYLVHFDIKIVLKLVFSLNDVCRSSLRYYD